MKNHINSLALALSLFFSLIFCASAQEFQIIDHGNLALGNKVIHPVVKKNPSRLMSERTKPVFIEVIPQWGYTAFGPHAMRSITDILSDSRRMDVGLRLRQEYLMSSSSQDDFNAQTTVWVSVVVWSEEDFSPTGLEFGTKSPDPKNAFGKFEVYGGSTNYIFSDTAVGYSSDGKQIPSGTDWSSVKVKMFTFLGSAIPVAKVGNQAEADGFSRWLVQQGPNFSITSTWSLREGGKIISSASRRLQISGQPISPMIHIHEGMIHTMGDEGNTFFVQRALSLSGIWSTVAQVTGKQDFLLSKEGSSAFYRIRSPW